MVAKSVRPSVSDTERYMRCAFSQAQQATVGAVIDLGVGGVTAFGSQKVGNDKSEADGDKIAGGGGGKGGRRAKGLVERGGVTRAVPVSETESSTQANMQQLEVTILSHSL